VCSRLSSRLLCSVQDVRVATNVNKYVWSQGVRHVPFRVRVKLSRKRNEDEEAKSKMYTLVELQEVPDFHELQTEKADD
jgi:large subunit ribosomal protein L31e